jgi:hypothetical protein
MPTHTDTDGTRARRRTLSAECEGDRPRNSLSPIAGLTKTRAEKARYLRSADGSAG